MNRITVLVTALSIGMISLNVKAGLFGYGNISECLLDKLSAAQNDVGVQVAIHDCGDTFPNRNIKTFPKINNWVFGPKNYKECIKEYGVKTPSSRALRFIAQVCKDAF